MDQKAMIETVDKAIAKLKEARKPGLTGDQRKELVREAYVIMQDLPEKWWRDLPDALGQKYFAEMEKLNG